MMKTSYNEVIVVEGEHDKERILRLIPEALVIITNGSEISKTTLETIKGLSKEHDIILFLDPDSPGERIRNIIEQAVPNVKHAFLEKKKAIDERKHKVGVEHAKDEDILASLNNLLTKSDKVGTLTFNDLYELGLIGVSSSSSKREQLSQVYPLGKTNGKSLLKRLNYLGITRKELEEILNG